MEFIQSTSGEENITIENIVYHNKEPNVFTIDNFLTQEECNHMINISTPHMKSSLVSYANKGTESRGRTSSNAWISHNHDEITKSIGEKIARFVGLPLENAEAYQVIHYGPGGEYRRHYDSWQHDGSKKTTRCMKYGGARLKTALVYLNDVEEGGSTNLNRINVDVSPKQGKLLVFDNTYSGTNIKHPLSEHAGMPVIKGEKYAFNLWFKECHSKKLYSEFNPEYYTLPDDNRESQNKDHPSITIDDSNSKLDSNSIIENINSLYKYTHLTRLNVFTRLNDKKSIYKLENVLDDKDCKKIMEKCEFENSTSKYVNCWVNNNKLPDIVNKIENMIGIKSVFFENMHVFKYSANQKHGPFMESYDITHDNGKKWTEKRGQRIYTITIPLNNTIETKFIKINTYNISNRGSLLIYDNILNTCKNVRDNELEHTIINENTSDTYLLNIYIRERDIKSNSLHSELISTTSLNSSEKEQMITEKTNKEYDITKEDYKDTFKKVLNKFENNEISLNWRGLNSFNYTFKGDYDYFTNTMSKYINTRIDDVIPTNIIDININETSNKICYKSGLNMENLRKTYTFDEYNPVTIENVLNSDTLNICQEYYSRNIENNVYIMGDKQSQRFKSHNEPLSRILHYEILPLIEKVVGKKLMPTYTYLSAYVKDSDLPAHTDRADCEYTVSFLINKPENSKWPIYLHKVKQPIKYKGRSVFTPSNDECFEIDCNAGGLMMFSGTDHIHFREKLPHDFYHIVLLHYCSV